MFTSSPQLRNKKSHTKSVENNLNVPRSEDINQDSRQQCADDGINEQTKTLPIVEDSPISCEVNGYANAEEKISADIAITVDPIGNIGFKDETVKEHRSNSISLSEKNIDDSGYQDISTAENDISRKATVNGPGEQGHVTFYSIVDDVCAGSCRIESTKRPFRSGWPWVGNQQVTHYMELSDEK